MSPPRCCLVLLAVGVLAVGLGGCALLPPAGSRGSSGASGSTGGASRAARRPARGRGRPAGGRPSASGSLVARADRTHEVPTPARPERALAGWSTPGEAVRAFAARYINWTATTVAARLRALARDCVGQARATLELQAREVGADRELQRGRIANSGVVEVVGRLAGAAGRFVVVTRERTRAAQDAAYRGLAPEWHVSVATVTRRGGRWVLSGWQPES